MSTRAKLLLLLLLVLVLYLLRERLGIVAREGLGLLSAGTLNLIKREEGKVLRGYLDQVGVLTIGYGHKVLPGEPYKLGEPIPEEEAERLLIADAQKFARCVDGAVTVSISDAQRSALISFAFNVGCAAFRNSTVLKKLNAGDTLGAAAAFKLWNKGTVGGKKVELPVLTARRERESQIFLGVMA